ncbi:hypothetical protein NDU88_006540 [Pleurodeles waltl]|uniref:Uncharacterized protein n=1 Tax=Pleurodeles waltl TaxID=8319 RepID=A0AAV7TXG1_PLEWA|nr:hypothetical protein NDU88_006540 [Pleurodeles waltl]
MRWTGFGPSSMFDHLLTSRPIRIEDGRDVRGRREGREKKAEREDATRRRSRRLLVGLIVSGMKIKNDSNTTQLPRILHFLPLQMATRVTASNMAHECSPPCLMVPDASGAR